MGWWKPADWFDDVTGAFEKAITDLKDAVTSVVQNLASDVRSVGDTLSSTGNTIGHAVAGGAVSTYETVTGGTAWVIDQNEVVFDQVDRFVNDATGEIRDFSVEAWENTRDFAGTAWQYLKQFAMQVPPSLGEPDPRARDFMGHVLQGATFDASVAESVLELWEGNAKEREYTMAIDFSADLCLAAFDIGAVAGVYVDNDGKWGFFADNGTISGSAGFATSVSAGFTVELYMLFGDRSAYEKSYYAPGASLSVKCFSVGATVFVTESGEFAGFKTEVGLGIDYGLFGGGNKRARDDSSVSAGASGPTLPRLDVFSVDPLAALGSTHDLAFQAAKTTSTGERSIVAGAATALTALSDSVIASGMVGSPARGNAFCDDPALVERIASVTLRGDTQVRAITITYQMFDGTTRTVNHGHSSAGSPQTLHLDADEHLLYVGGSYDLSLTKLTLITSRRRSITVGAGGGKGFQFPLRFHQPVLSFFGRTGGDHLDALGVYYRSGAGFNIIAKHSFKYLDIAGELDAGEGVAALQANSDRSIKQEWLLVPAATTSDRYYIVNRSTGRRLACSSSAQGSGVVQQAPVAGDAMQRWQLKQLTDGFYNLVNEGTGLFADVYGGWTQSGTNIIAWPGHGGDNQQWRLSPVAPAAYLFTGVGFTGSVVRLAPGRYPSAAAAGLTDDALRSLRVPDGWRVTLYEGESFTGEATSVTRDAASLGTLAGKVSSFVVETPPWGVTIYEHVAYSGASQALMPGRHDLSQIRIGGDTLSSIKIVPGWRVTLYADPGFTGKATILTGDCDDLRRLSINDTISSIVVERDPLGQVVLFTQPGFKGEKRAFGPGRYDYNSFVNEGPGNDAAASARVPPGWTVALYEHDFSGRKRILKADCSDFGDFSRMVSSIEVIAG